MVLSCHLYAQTCTNQLRVYANSQFETKVIPFLSSGSITDPEKAVDSDPLTHSTLNLSVILSGNITQFLEFKEADKTTRKTIIGPRTVYVKLSLPSTFLNAGSSLDIGTFRYTTGSTYVQNTKYNGSTVLGVAAGAGTIEVPIVLAAGENINGVYVKLVGGIASIPLTTDLYGAYILENTSVIPDCDKAIDVLSGLSDNSILPIGSSFGSITDPEKAIDALPYTSYATLSAGLNVLNSAYLTAVFARPSVAGDSVKIIMQNLGGGLNLLSGLSISTYLGETAVGGTVGLANVTSKAVPGYPALTEISFPVNASFDRVRISYGGAVGLSGSVRVYNVTKVIPKPEPLIDGVPLVTKDVCFAVPKTVLSVNNIQACTTYNWYADPTTTTSLSTGATYEISGLSIGTHVYYVESRRDNCTASISERVKVTINVNPLPTVSVANTTTCSGSSATLSVDSPLTGIAYRWYNASVNGTLLTTANTYTTPILSADQTYYVEAYNTVTGCLSSSRATATVTVKPIAAISTTTGPASVCVGAATSLTNTTTGGTWSSLNPSVATVNSSGQVFGVSAGATTIRYSIAATSATCANSTDFSISVDPLPGITLGPDPEICEGFISASLSYSNPANAPITYSISWTSSDFAAVNDQPLPLGSIPIAVPAHMTPNTYAGVLTIKNANGCSTQINFNIKINPKPAAPHVLLPTSSQY